jgi:hypothetical protein
LRDRMWSGFRSKPHLSSRQRQGSGTGDPEPPEEMCGFLYPGQVRCRSWGRHASRRS